MTGTRADGDANPEFAFSLRHGESDQREHACRRQCSGDDSDGAKQSDHRCCI